MLRSGQTEIRYLVFVPALTPGIMKVVLVFLGSA